MVKRFPRRAAALAVAGATCFAIAACGSDESPSTAASGPSVTSGAGAQGLAEARAEVAKLRSQPTDIGVSQPLTAKPTGKQVAILFCGAPVCAEAVGLVEEPLKLLGAEPKAFNGGPTPSSIAAAAANIVQSKPDSVIVLGVPPILWKEQLAQLAEAKIPVLMQATNPPPGQEDDVTAHFADLEYLGRSGKELANMVIADSGGKAKSIFIWEPELVDFKALTDAFVDTLKQRCPGCSNEVLTTKTSDIGKRLPGQVVSALQRDPKIDYVVIQSGDMVTGVPEALKAAGISGVKIVTNNGSPSNQVYIAKGEQYADLASFLHYQIWRLVDATARATVGEELPTYSQFPLQWITKANSNYEGFAPFGSDFKSEFKKLWGVS